MRALRPRSPHLPVAFRNGSLPLPRCGRGQVRNPFLITIRYSLFATHYSLLTIPAQLPGRNPGIEMHRRNELRTRLVELGQRVAVEKSYSSFIT